MHNDQTFLMIRRKLIGHGALIVFLAGIIGFGFLFFLIGKIALWPIPGEIQYQLPGTYDAWRMAHMEGIINGLMLWLVAALIHLLPFAENTINRVGYGFIIVAWTIVLASALDPLFPNSRGLEFGGPVTNNLAFFLFYVGVLLVMVLMAAIAYKSLVNNGDTGNH